MRISSHLPAIFLLVAVASTLSACSSDYGVAPSSSTSPSGSAVASLAVVEIPVFEVNLFRRVVDDVFLYEPARLDIAESGGKSGVTLTTINLVVPGGTPGLTCTPQEQVVQIKAGERRDVAKYLGYCAPYVLSSGEVAEVSVVGTFIDESGLQGQFKRTVSVSSCTLSGKTGTVLCVSPET
jgi:hypothetical protein